VKIKCENKSANGVKVRREWRKKILWGGGRSGERQRKDNIAVRVHDLFGE